MNIHLERYKQQIHNEAWMPAGDPADTAHLHPQVDVVGVCETLVDEIGDKTLQNLSDLFANSTDRDLVEFCHTLGEYLESQLAYRNAPTEEYNDFQDKKQSGGGISDPDDEEYWRYRGGDR